MQTLSGFYAFVCEVGLQSLRDRNRKIIKTRSDSSPIIIITPHGEAFWFGVLLFAPWNNWYYDYTHIFTFFGLFKCLWFAYEMLLFEVMPNARRSSLFFNYFSPYLHIRNSITLNTFASSSSWSLVHERPPASIAWALNETWIMNIFIA